MIAQSLDRMIGMLDSTKFKVFYGKAEDLLRAKEMTTI